MGENKRIRWEFERDCDLRGYWVEGLLDIQKQMQEVMAIKEKRIFIPDYLLRALYQSIFPHRTTWQEWKAWEMRKERQQKKFNAEVKKYKRLDLNREVSIMSSVADIVAKSEQLAENELAKARGLVDDGMV